MSEASPLAATDLHAYPGTQTWIRSQGPYPEFLAQYWGHAWTPKTEADVVADFAAARVQAVLVAFFCAETRPAQTWLNGSRRHVGLYDLDVRFRVMDRFLDYRQVLTLATPPIEQVATGAAGPGATGQRLARGALRHIP